MNARKFFGNENGSLTPNFDYLIKNGGTNILKTVIDIVGYDERPQYLENIYQPINKTVLDQFRKGLDLLCVFFTTPFRKMVGK